LVVLRFKGFSAYAGGLALSLIMIPLILRTTEEVVLLVPNGYREAALALGVSRWKTIVHIVMKTASRDHHRDSARARPRGGETAPLLFTAFGNRFGITAESADRSAGRCRFLPMQSLPMMTASAGVGRRAGARHWRFLR